MRSLYRRHLGQAPRKALGVDRSSEANGELCCSCFCLSVYGQAPWAPAHTIAWRQHNERAPVPLPHKVLETISVRMEREHGRMPMTALCSKNVVSRGNAADGYPLPPCVFGWDVHA